MATTNGSIPVTKWRHSSIIWNPGRTRQSLPAGTPPSVITVHYSYFTDLRNRALFLQCSDAVGWTTQGHQSCTKSCFWRILGHCSISSL